MQQAYRPTQVQLVSPISATPPAGNQESTCKVCYEAPVNSVLIPCGHAGLCVSCAQMQKTSGKGKPWFNLFPFTMCCFVQTFNVPNLFIGCPFCRAPINDVIKQYLV